ncbi:carbohydrate ABC transporter permease [Allonocardiopsis opalescens]|uniref:Carbohydrate ABC transporter membrane protein 2 (CUT1 family) n=1 Tax=Allonocardiopsis opalescens TaxID=1144618 RepID=A0A2T0Q725_9ACTN|nr:carbohydrate ABC transporter permease [Allonocardiopsis opalescens]PRX99635.1 carbohydrate ABC transporter membrane protein 2 (CUT1 family) [Allonocardiopsis opalescens]
MTSQRERALTYTILIAFAVFALYPMFTMLGTALEPGSDAPGGLGNFAVAWEQGRFGSYLRSSLIVSVVTVAIATVLSILSGYAFGTMRFPGSTALFYLILIGIMVPTEAVVVPLYYDFRDLGLTDTYAALILPQLAQSVAFGTFWMRTYFLTSSRGVAEAARIDGTGHWGTLWRVLVPMGRPAIITLVVLTFMWTWNEFMIPLVMVTSESLRTAPLGLAFFDGQYVSATSLLAAGAVIVALPVVVLYLFLQRHFIQGIIEGSTKE